MPLSRRRFLLMTSLMFVPLGMLNGCSQRTSVAEKNLIMGGGRFVDPGNGKVRNVFSVVDLDAGKTSLLDVDFLPHGIHLHPDQPNRLAVFEKKGPHACEIDLANLRITRVIKTDEKRHFYGHGSYSADNKLLYCTETYLDGYDGIIAVRDSDTHEYLGEFPTYGKEPHECKLIDNGNVLVVTNGGGRMNDEPASVTYIDVKSEKLLDKVLLTNPDLNTGHMAIGDDGSLVVVSAPRAGLDNSSLGGVSIRPSGESMQTIASPVDVTKRMKGEALSVVIHDKQRIAAVTHPDGDMVTFWQIDKRQLLHTIPLPRPRGVSISTDGKFFLISYDTNPKLMKVSAANIKANPAIVSENTFISGSHIYNWSREFAEIGTQFPHLHT